MPAPDRIAGEASHMLTELATKVEAVPHMSRSLNCELKEVEGAKFSQNYLGSIDAARRLVPDGYSWCVGITVDADNIATCWANVHNEAPYGRRIDLSVNGASPEIALCAASLRARAAIAKATGGSDAA